MMWPIISLLASLSAMMAQAKDESHRLPRGRFLVDVEEAQRPPHNIIDAAFVTFVTNVPYVPGVEALVQSLDETGSATPLIIMTPSPVSTELADALERIVSCSKGRRFQAQVVNVPQLANPYSSHQARYGGSIMSKLYLFSERIAARRVIYLDCDMLVLQPIEHLMADVQRGSLSAAPDCGISCYTSRPNTGVIGTMPDGETMTNLLHALTSGMASYDGADQGFLTTYFVNERRQGGWLPISSKYNRLKRRCVAPAAGS